MNDNLFSHTPEIEKFGQTAIPEALMESPYFDNQNIRKIQQKKLFMKKLHLISYKKETDIKTITLSLASPQEILRWTERILPNGKIIGKVTNANTLHYKTFKPQKGGLFCERIFGPLKDFECACGKTQKLHQNLIQTIFPKITSVVLTSPIESPSRFYNDKIISNAVLHSVVNTTGSEDSNAGSKENRTDFKKIVPITRSSEVKKIFLVAKSNNIKLSETQLVNNSSQTPEILAYLNSDNIDKYKFQNKFLLTRNSIWTPDECHLNSKRSIFDLSKIQSSKQFYKQLPNTRKYCQNCDVEYTWSIFRRYQLGYIQLTLPVTHVWYLKGTTSLLGNLLGLKKKVIISMTYNSETTVLETSQKSNQMNNVLRTSSPFSIFKSWKKLQKKMSEEYFFDKKIHENNVQTEYTKDLRFIENRSPKTNVLPKRFKSWRIEKKNKSMTTDRIFSKRCKSSITLFYNNFFKKKKLQTSDNFWTTNISTNIEKTLKSSTSFYIVFKKNMKKKKFTIIQRILQNFSIQDDRVHSRMVRLLQRIWKLFYKKALDKALKKTEKIILYLLVSPIELSNNQRFKMNSATFHSALSYFLSRIKTRVIQKNSGSFSINKDQRVEFNNLNEIQERSILPGGRIDPNGEYFQKILNLIEDLNIHNFTTESIHEYNDDQDQSFKFKKNSIEKNSIQSIGTLDESKIETILEFLYSFFNGKPISFCFTKLSKSNNQEINPFKGQLNFLQTKSSLPEIYLFQFTKKIHIIKKNLYDQVCFSTRECYDEIKSSYSLISNPKIDFNFQETKLRTTVTQDVSGTLPFIFLKKQLPDLQILFETLVNSLSAMLILFFCTVIQGTPGHYYSSLINIVQEFLKFETSKKEIFDQMLQSFNELLDVVNTKSFIKLRKDSEIKLQTSIHIIENIGSKIDHPIYFFSNSQDIFWTTKVLQEHSYTRNVSFPIMSFNSPLAKSKKQMSLTHFLKTADKKMSMNQNSITQLRVRQINENLSNSNMIFDESKIQSSIFDSMNRRSSSRKEKTKLQEFGQARIPAALLQSNLRFIDSKRQQFAQSKISAVSVQLSKKPGFNSIDWSNVQNQTRVFNNFYQFSFIHRWYDSYSFQCILIYVSSPTNFDDKIIPNYFFRSFSSENMLTNCSKFGTKLVNTNTKKNIWSSFENNAATDPSFSGAGLLQKILFQFNINEVLIQNLIDLKKLPEMIFDIQKKIREHKQYNDKQNNYLLRNTEILNSFLIIKNRLLSNSFYFIKKKDDDIFVSNDPASAASVIFNKIFSKKNQTIIFKNPHLFFQKRHDAINRRVQIKYKIQKKISIFIKAKNDDDEKLKNLRKKLTILKQLKMKLIRRIKLFQLFEKRKMESDSMILKILPVLPADLRPIMKLGDQIAASDLNRLYQRIIYRNDRLKKFLKESVTMNSEVTRFAHRLLQEAVDNLIENGKSGVKPETDSRGRALKSLSAILKGKGGHFRQYLLGKRVDYSGRSVIVVGPKLKMHECGIPYDMAIELFLPFLLKRVLNYNLAQTVVGAKTLIRTNKQLTKELLREIMTISPVLLNRAPTLHRLGIQAFQPKLVDGKAIILHPLVCPAFNADFDGDQMAVHVPITIEARAEALKLMFSRNNLLSPATGDPLVLPSQDMVLGCYYLTTEKFFKQKFEQTLFYNLRNPTFGSILPDGKIDQYLHSSSRQGESIQLYNSQSAMRRMYFNSLEDVFQKYNQMLIRKGEITFGEIYPQYCQNLHSNIWLKMSKKIETGAEHEQPIEIRVNRFGFKQEIYSKILRNYDNLNNKINQYIKTTPGKIIFNLLIEKSIKIKNK